MISIITATRDRHDVLLDCIRSVASQNINDLEHIVIDGGEAVSAFDLASSLRADRFHYLREPDRGIYDAFNKGIRRAKGDVIGFLNSDDFYVDENVLRDVQKVFEDPSIDVVYGDLKYVSPSKLDKIVRYWKSGAFSRASLVGGWVPPHPTVFCRRSIYERFGYFDDEFKIAGDYEFLLRVLSSPDVRVAYIPRTLVHMRMGGISDGLRATLGRKTYEDYTAIKRHRIGGMNTLLLKKFKKLKQFFF